VIPQRRANAQQLTDVSFVARQQHVEEPPRQLVDKQALKKRSGLSDIHDWQGLRSAGRRGKCAARLGDS
jgi:hypothetical protein